MPYFFATCYSTITNFPWYSKLWHMDLLIFYSSFSLISLSSSPSAIQYSPHGFLSTTDFLSTITDLLHQFFFPLLFALSSLFYLRVAYRRGSGFGFVIFDCDQRGRRSLGCGFVNSDCDWRGFGLWVSVLSWVSDSLFVVLRVTNSLFYLWRFHQFVLHLLHTGKFSIFSVIL